MRLWILMAVFLAVLTGGASALDLKSLWSQMSSTTQNASLDQTPVAGAVREALKTGIDRTVQALGKKDGYFANPAVKIPLPDKLAMLDKGLRAMGLGSRIDDFVLGMNRSAEAAAPYARDIFVDSIMKMSVTDAENIIHGPQTAATDYFSRAARPQLVAAITPIVQKKMGENAIAAKYQDLTARFKATALGRMVPVPRIEPYVVNKSLDGMFYTLGQEEKKIRTDPAARTTELLKQYFAN